MLLCQQGPSSQSYGFSSSHIWMRELDYKESWAPKNWCFQTVVPEKTRESPLDCKEIKPVNSKGTLNIHRKDECWSWSSNTLAPWCKELTHWKRSRCWERLKAGEGDDRGWDDWMVSLTQWTWVLTSSGRWWRTGTSDVLQPMGSQRVGPDWETGKQNAQNIFNIFSVFGRWPAKSSMNIFIGRVHLKTNKKTQNPDYS